MTCPAYYVAFGPHGPRKPINPPGTSIKVAFGVFTLIGLSGATYMAVRASGMCFRFSYSIVLACRTAPLVIRGSHGTGFASRLCSTDVTSYLVSIPLVITSWCELVARRFAHSNRHVRETDSPGHPTSNLGGATRASFSCFSDLAHPPNSWLRPDLCTPHTIIFPPILLRLALLPRHMLPSPIGPLWLFVLAKC